MPKKKGRRRPGPVRGPSLKARFVNANERFAAAVERFVAWNEPPKLFEPSLETQALCRIATALEAIAAAATSRSDTARTALGFEVHRHEQNVALEAQRNQIIARTTQHLSQPIEGDEWKHGSTPPEGDEDEPPPADAGEDGGPRA